MPLLKGVHIHITGIVQGVGFRPFVYNLARQYSLSGWVKNTSAGVDIRVDGVPDILASFINDLQNRTPPLAHVDSFTVQECDADGFRNFEIIESEAIPAAFQPISPDICICPDCLRELFDPNDRRYHYPFINCTNCGPRFTIIRDIPYDRPNTTMAGFSLCPECAAEYQNPLDRRFHAQPVACPICGPRVWLELITEDGSGSIIAQSEDAIQQVQQLLLEGKVVAIKGLGGFHLACDATNPEAVAELRRRKLRVDKPFALMFANIEQLAQHCILGAPEQELIESPARPIVLLRRQYTSSISEEVAPGQPTLGVMLPYTPLHYLLFASISRQAPAQVLVMTSGNLSEEPIVTDNEEARSRLSTLADALLMHDRPIHIRTDDSVMRVFPTTTMPYPIRRSRGYTPFPVRLPWETQPILAAGGELKNTFCMTNGNYAFLSHHIGDLENYETLRSFEDGITHFESLFRIKPKALAYDLHPDYLSTRYILERAERQGLPAIGIQHHHAHIASLMVEHQLDADHPAIGVAFDGTGYGDDGAIWGGEFLVANYSGYQRVAHLTYTPLPGGDLATRKPSRIALAHLWQAGLEWNPELPPVADLCVEERQALRSQLEFKINTPLTSSVGRLFDAVAALAGVRQRVNYEAQAAIELEALVDPAEKNAYPIDIMPVEFDLAGQMSRGWSVDLKSLIWSVCDDIYSKTPPSIISARFHNGLADLVIRICILIRSQTNISTVALSGGVWQNMTLLALVYNALIREGFEVLTHQQIPTNDGGLSLGQAAIAAQYYWR